jgi:hypothetical protein
MMLNVTMRMFKQQYKVGWKGFGEGAIYLYTTLLAHLMIVVYLRPSNDREGQVDI